MTQIAIKLSSKAMDKLPDCCDDCIYYRCEPDPEYGWADVCDLCHKVMNDRAPDEWMYDGSNRPKACPLIEVTGSQGKEWKDEDAIRRN